MAVILALQDRANQGKTLSLTAFAHQLLAQRVPHRIIVQNPNPLPALSNTSTDFRLVVEITAPNGKTVIVGVESEGDPNTKLKDRLDELVNVYKCDVIVCATRKTGDTVWAVNHISTTYGFQEIWTSPYTTTVPAYQPIVNRQKGNDIFYVLQSLGLI